MPGVKFSQEIFDEICHRIGEGESLREICQDLHMPHRATVAGWLLDDSKVGGPLGDQYARAHELQADFYAEEIIHTARNTETGLTEKHTPHGVETTFGDMTQHRRLKIDALKWAAGKRAPKKYGEKIAVEHSGNVQQISDAELDAKLTALTQGKTP